MPNDRPNILLITTDHQRYDCVGVNDNPIIKTPVLDDLARGGVNFDRCYVQNPVCMPSRASIFTGRYCQNHGVRTNGIPLPETEVTLAHALTQAGYCTGNIGKLHFTPHKDRDHYAPHPLYGFQTLVLSDEPGCYPDAYIRSIRERAPEYLDKVKVPAPYYGGPRGNFDYWKFEAPEELSHPAWVADETIKYIKQHADQPFFAAVGFYAPHPPANPPAKYVDMYDVSSMPLPIRRDGEMDDKPGLFKGGPKRHADIPDDKWREAKAYFYAMCSLADAHIGRIVERLKEVGVYENTLIVFVSDHGDALGDHWHVAKGPTNYDSIIHAPLIIHWPNGLPAGARVSGFVESVDILPTILEAADADVPPGVKGRSLLPVIRGEAEARSDILCEFKQVDGVIVKTIQTNEWKYSCYNGAEVLFDLTNDPDEFVNVANDSAYKDALSEMRGLMVRRLLDAEDDLPERVNLY